MKQFLLVALVSLSVSQAFWVQSATADDLTGQGEWQSLSGEAIHGTWSVNLRRTAGRLEGTMTMTGSPSLRVVTVTGTIDGQQIVMGAAEDGASKATFSGRLVGESISGEWTFALLSDEGVWSGSLRLH